MEIFIWIVFIIIGFIVATITWKLYPHFISKRERYVNSPFEILQQRGIKTFAAFVITLVFGYCVIKGIKENDQKNHKMIDSTEQMSNHKQTHNKKHKTKKISSVSEKTVSEKGLTEDTAVAETKSATDTTTLNNQF